MKVAEQDARQRKADRRAELRDHRVPAAVLRRRVQRQQRSKTVPCAAEGKALTEAKECKERDRPVADLVVARQEGDRGGRAAEQEERDRQLCAAAVNAVDRHEDDGTDGAGKESQREDCKGIERRRQPVRREREDKLREDKDRRETVDEEVEKFGHAPDNHADGDTARRDRSVVVNFASVTFQRRSMTVRSVPAAI